MRTVFAAASGMLLLLGCQKAPSGQAPRGGELASKSPAGWLSYEDDLFRISYPPGSDVFGANGGKSGNQDKAHPGFAIVPPPAAGKSLQGGISLQFDSKTKGMLLRDAIQSEVRKVAGVRGQVLGSLREFKVKNGLCLAAIVMVPSDACPKGQGDCFTPFYQTQCDGPDGSRYYSPTMLSDCRSKDSLSTQAQQEAAVYERMLASLEFKKPAP